MTMISVLYVDDEAGLLEIGKLFLERIGTITVDVVASARDALRRLASASYDVIVSDYQMPGMDGIEFLRNIRMGSDIPFILFTSRSREEVAITALDSGADYYVQKGGNPTAQFAELSHDIHQIVKHRKIEADLQREQEFSRALLETLVIDTSDQQQVETLPCPALETAPASQRSTTGVRSPAVQKTRTSTPHRYGIVDTIHRLVRGTGAGAGLYEEPACFQALIRDLVIGPEDLYRMRVLPCPVRETASGFRHSGSW